MYRLNSMLSMRSPNRMSVLIPQDLPFRKLDLRRQKFSMIA